MKIIRFIRYLVIIAFFIFLFLFLNESYSRKSSEHDFTVMQEEMKKDISEITIQKDQGYTYKPPKYLSELMNENPYVVGWIIIDDTNINYPIVQNKEDNDFFLKKDINGEKSSLGSVFLDSNQDINGTGLKTIYAHNMKNGSMFKDVTKYLDKSYMENHKSIFVYTDQEMIRLEPFYCYYGIADDDYREDLKREELKEFIKEKTGKDIDTDAIYVLVTCSYNTGRYADERTYLLCTKKES